MAWTSAAVAAPPSSRTESMNAKSSSALMKNKRQDAGGAMAQDGPARAADAPPRPVSGAGMLLRVRGFLLMRQKYQPFKRVAKVGAGCLVAFALIWTIGTYVMH